jgi:hypothetical protein
MAGTSIGSIYARIGADTSQFQQALASSNSDLGRWAGGVDGQTVRVESSMLRISRSASTVMTSMGLMGGQVDFAIARILGSLGMLELAMPAALLVMAPKIGEFVNKITGLRDAFATAAPPAMAMGEALFEDADRFKDAQDQLKHLLDQLGIAQPLWLQNGARTRENAEATVRWMTEMHKLVKELRDADDATVDSIANQNIIDARLAEKNKLLQTSVDWLTKSREQQILFNDVWGKMIPVGTQVAMALGRGQAAMKDLGDETIKAYGILSETSALASVEDMEKKLRAVSLAGGDVGQVLEKMGPDITKAIEEAKKMGVAIPPMMEDVALAIDEKNKFWLGDLMASLKRTPDAAREAAAGSAKYLEAMGKNLEGSISGGFGRGIDEGTDYGKQQIDAFIRGIEGRPIKITFDVSDLDKAIADALSGRRRGTPGMAPS